MENKKSSVEFAVEKLEAFIPSGNQLAIYAILEQAKAMHKEEMIQFADKYESYAHMATISNRYAQLKSAEYYYNETFGGNNE